MHPHWTPTVPVFNDGALKNAVREAVDLLGKLAGLSVSDAYALCSLAVDFRIGEALNEVLMVYGAIPKRLFRRKLAYWAE